MPLAPVSPPSPAHPIAYGDTVFYYWPPQTGAIVSLYFDAWSRQKHIVFFAHGKFGWYASMYNHYCTTGVTDLKCPQLELEAYKNLVFVFGSSGLQDAGYGGASGWSTNANDASTYSQAANALANIADELKLKHDDTEIEAFNCKTEEHEYCYKPYFHRFYAYMFRMQDRDSQSVGSKLQKEAPTKRSRTKYHMGEYCYTIKRTYCPFNANTEMMVIGFSDGGGLATYMNYLSPMVSKGVGIDFWAYASYEAWLSGTTPSDSVDMKIYTNCESSYFAYGPAALFPESGPSPPVTFVSELSLPTPPTVSSPVGYTAGAMLSEAPSPPSPENFHEFEFFNCTADQKITIAIHGLSTYSPALSYTDDDQWVEDSSHTPASYCNSNNMGANPHAIMMDYADLLGDIDDWLDWTYWSCPETERRQLFGGGMVKGFSSYARMPPQQQAPMTSEEKYKEVNNRTAFLEGKYYSNSSFGYFPPAADVVVHMEPSRFADHVTVTAQQKADDDAVPQAFCASGTKECIKW
jgi:hypothetical protein